MFSSIRLLIENNVESRLDHLQNTEFPSVHERIITLQSVQNVSNERITILQTIQNASNELVYKTSEVVNTLTNAVTLRKYRRK